MSLNIANDNAGASSVAVARRGGRNSSRLGDGGEDVCQFCFSSLLFFNGHKRGAARLPLLLAAVFLAVTSDTTVSSPPPLPSRQLYYGRKRKKKVHTVFSPECPSDIFRLIS